MLLARLVETSAAIAATRSRKAKASHLADLLAELEPSEVPVAVAYLGGELPQGRIGIGYAAIDAVEATPAGTPTLTIHAVDEALTTIASISGKGSQSARGAVLGDLLGAATATEQDFIRRLLLRELRQGALEGIMVDALAATTDIEVAAIRRATMVSGDLPAVASAALTLGPAALDAFRLTLFQPLQPMLAQTTPDGSTALERFSPAIAEVKLDGARIQIHKAQNRIEAYTRNLRKITSAIPGIVAAVSAFDAEHVILDGEAIALRPDGTPSPFQVTMSRFGRDGDADTTPGPGPNDAGLTGFFFDILHLDGDDLIDLPLEERLELLDRVVGADHRPLREIVADGDTVARFFQRVIAAGHEGVMLKDPASPYAAGRRGSAWLKLKPAHTLDLVVLAAEWGSGRRSGWLSNLHLGARDPASGDYVMLGKTFKGLTDATLEWQTERLLALETHRQGHAVYVRPEQVVEVAFDGIQASTRYPGGMALRFARVKGYREDKAATEADTVETVRAIFEGRRLPL